MKKHQQGFTLIELMIVVAIIGILAAIAIPAYTDYTARSQMSEALTLASGGKTAVVDYWANEGKWPADNAAAGLEAAADIKGNYVESVTVTTGKIAAKIAGSGAAKGIQGKTLTLSPIENAGSIAWSCSADADDKYLPQNCR